MAKWQIDANEKMELLAYLESLLGCVKSPHATLGTVMEDVSAVHDTMFEDAEEMIRCKRKLKMAVATAKPMADEALHAYDELLEEFVASQPYMN